MGVMNSFTMINFDGLELIWIDNEGIISKPGDCNFRCTFQI